VRFQTAMEMRRAIDVALDAPLKKRAGRRTLGFVALTATMALAAVLLVGKASQIRASVPWLRAPVKTELAAVATPAPEAPAPEAAPIPAPSPAPATLAAVAPAVDPAVAAEDAEEGDFVDDTLPTPSQAVAAPEVAPPAKAKARKHVAKKVADAKSKPVDAVAKAQGAPAGDAAPAEKSADAKAPPRAVKAHRKHKGSVASKAP
jgi:hypothetical protein